MYENVLRLAFECGTYGGRLVGNNYHVNHSPQLGGTCT